MFLKAFEELYSPKVVHYHFSDIALLNLLKNKNDIHVSLINITKNKLIVKDTCKCTKIFYLVNGIAKIEANDEVVGFLEQNKFIGFDNALAPRVNCQVYSLTNSQLLVFDRKKVFQVLDNSQEGWLFHYLHNQKILLDIEARNEKLTINGVERLKGIFLELSMKFGRTENNQYVWIPTCFSKTTIASYAHLSMERFNMIFAQLKAENLVIHANNRGFCVNQSKLLKGGKEEET